jgi:15-hydroxyprostaglandin dehydrogenase (NAD)
VQGIGERSKFYEPKEELPEGFPPKPSTLTLEVNLLGVVYTAYLALHFFRKNTTKSGKLVMTSSASALYPSGSLALYAAAKHAVGPAIYRKPSEVQLTPWDKF